jgi:predicted nucleic acid-binding protein
VVYREEPAQIVDLWHRLADLPSVSPKVWMDAYLAAFAITGGMTMVSLDQDFASFKKAGLELVLLEPV